MKKEQIKELIDLSPKFIEHKKSWCSYDEQADVLYINFKKPSYADNSKLTDDDIIIRYEKGGVIGITILHAKKRQPGNYQQKI